MLAETILALMLTVGPEPGVSPHSVVRTTDPHRPCADMRPVCRKPWFSVWHKSLVRQENWAEGLHRYWTIAQAVASVAGADDTLALQLLTITRHESSWRRDIHSGIGPNALGDGGRSWSLIQARLGRDSEDGAKLVGVSSRRTTQALGWAARHMARCRGTGEDVFACYGGVSRKHKGIAARIKTYRRMAQLAKTEPELAEAVRSELGLDTPPSKNSRR